MKAGRTASTRDLLEAEKTFHRIMDNDPIGKTQGESTDD
jgi:hypothetical protein